MAANYTTKQVIQQLGQSNIARALGLSRNVVYHWLQNGVPPKHCKALVEYAKSNGVDVESKDFRPDIFD